MIHCKCEECSKYKSDGCTCCIDKECGYFIDYEKHENEINDIKSDIVKECKYLLTCGMGKKKSLEHLIKILAKKGGTE